MVAVGEGGVIVKTTDGGASWSSRTSGTSEDLYGINFGAGGVVAVGANGTMIVSVDLGETWAPRTSGTTADLHAVSTSTQNSAWTTAVGDGGTIVKTTNAGATWFPQFTPTTEDLRGVYALANALQFAVGIDGTVLKTTDGGQDPPTAVADLGADGPGGLLGAPNPFRSATTLRFTLPERAEVRLTVHDAAGRVVRRLLDGPRGAGPHRTIWDGRDSEGAPLPAGVYFSRLEVGDRAESAKLLKLR
jgi:hypothetical protein